MPDDRASHPPVNLRCFVAVFFERHLMDKLAQLQQQIQREIGGNVVRWVTPEQLHLTLKFLGNVPAHEIENLKHAVARACDRKPSMELALETVGCFPSCKRPRVIWVGLKGNLEALRDLYESLDARLAPFGSHEESRGFKPHLTLGRVRDPRSPSARVSEALQKRAETVLGLGQINEVRLMQSKLSPKGSTYTVLAEFPLSP